MFIRLSIVFLWAAFWLSPVSVWSKGPSTSNSESNNSESNSESNKLVEEVELNQNKASDAEPYGLITSVALEVAPPVTEIGKYINPLFGLHGQLAWDKLQYWGILPYASFDFAFAGGQRDVKNYFHAGSGVGALRPFPIQQFDQLFEVSPFVSTGLLWGSINKDTKSKGFVLPYSSLGVEWSWLIRNAGAVRSLDASLGYTHLFSGLTSGYVTIHLGATMA